MVEFSAVRFFSKEVSIVIHQFFNSMRNSMKKSKNRGFTLIEILIVIGLIAILAAVVLIAINPARQFAQGRDAQRISNLNTILNAIGQRTADGKGIFDGTFTVGSNTYTCPVLPSATTTIRSASAATGGIDLSCLVPTYLPAFPFDPDSKRGSGSNTGYDVAFVNGRVWVSSSSTESAITRSVDLYIVR
jgi:type IV pilus assembly protein PilA